MSIKRYAAKRDKNEADIVRVLEYVGATVTPLSDTGCPDLLVGYDGENYLLEVKGKRGKLTVDQIAWHQTWAGSVQVVRNADEALRALGLKGAITND